MHKLVSTKVIIGVQSLHLLPIERMELLLSYYVPHKTMINTDFMSDCMCACGEFLIALCCAYSLQMYKFPVGHGRQKHCVCEKLVINPLCSPAISICCIIRQWDVGEFHPGVALLVDVDLTTHSCEVLSSSFKTTDSPGVPKAV
jgi:hypothetical protein